jgi:hypothetical protein
VVSVAAKDVACAQYFEIVASDRIAAESVDRPEDVRSICWSKLRHVTDLVCGGAGVCTVGSGSVEAWTPNAEAGLLHACIWSILSFSNEIWRRKDRGFPWLTLRLLNGEMQSAVAGVVLC